MGAFASTDCTGVLSYTRYDIAANGACYSSGGGQSLQIVCGVAPNRNIAVKTWTTSENCEGNPSFTGNRAEESQACIQLSVAFAQGLHQPQRSAVPCGLSSIHRPRSRATAHLAPCVFCILWL